MPHSIPLIPSHVPLLSSADPASQRSPSFCRFTSVRCPSIHASFSDTLHYSSSNRHCCWSASQRRTSSKGRVSVSQQINALLADWSTPPGLEPESTVVWPRYRGDAIPTCCHSGGLAWETVIHTFNLPASVTVEQWDAVVEKGFDRSEWRGVVRRR